MSKELLAHIFSSLQSLEKCLENSKRMYALEPVKATYIAEALTQQTEVLGQMRRVANKLQLDIAAQDVSQINRSMQIYYGLTSIVRPEILSTFRSLANGKGNLELAEQHSLVH